MKTLIPSVIGLLVVGCGKKQTTNTNEGNNTPKADPKEVEVKNQDPPKADPKKLIANPIIEKAIRKELKKPKGELTEADYEKLTFLDLYNTKITDAGIKKVSKLQQLAALDLYNTKITDAGLKEVAKLEKLTVLGLSRTQITDAGLKEVAKLQQLTVLSLLFTKVTKAGVAELQKALPKCEIDH